MVGDRWLVVRLGKEGGGKARGWLGRDVGCFLSWLVGWEGGIQGGVGGGWKETLVGCLAGWLVGC